MGQRKLKARKTKLNDQKKIENEKIGNFVWKAKAFLVTFHKINFASIHSFDSFSQFTLECDP